MSESAELVKKHIKFDVMTRIVKPKETLNSQPKRAMQKNLDILVNQNFSFGKPMTRQTNLGASDEFRSVRRYQTVSKEILIQQADSPSSYQLAKNSKTSIKPRSLSITSPKSLANSQQVMTKHANSIFEASNVSQQWQNRQEHAPTEQISPQ